MVIGHAMYNNGSTRRRNGNVHAPPAQYLGALGLGCVSPCGDFVHQISSLAPVVVVPALAYHYCARFGVPFIVPD